MSSTWTLLNTEVVAAVPNGVDGMLELEEDIITVGLESGFLELMQAWQTRGLSVLVSAAVTGPTGKALLFLEVVG